MTDSSDVSRLMIKIRLVEIENTILETIVNSLDERNDYLEGRCQYLVSKIAILMSESIKQRNIQQIDSVKLRETKDKLAEFLEKQEKSVNNAMSAIFKTQQLKKEIEQRTQILKHSVHEILSEDVAPYISKEEWQRNEEKLYEWYKEQLESYRDFTYSNLQNTVGVLEKIKDSKLSQLVNKANTQVTIDLESNEHDIKEEPI